MHIDNHKTKDCTKLTETGEICDKSTLEFNPLTSWSFLSGKCCPVFQTIGTNTKPTVLLSMMGGVANLKSPDTCLILRGQVFSTRVLCSFGSQIQRKMELTWGIKAKRSEFSGYYM